MTFHPGVSCSTISFLLVPKRVVNNIGQLFNCFHSKDRRFQWKILNSSMSYEKKDFYNENIFCYKKVSTFYVAMNHISF